MCLQRLRRAGAFVLLPKAKLNRQGFQGFDSTGWGERRVRVAVGDVHMRHLICAALGLGLAVSATTAGAQALKPARPPAAVSAERYGVRTNYVDARAGHGYSAQARRTADCLATFPSYDPRTDRVTLRSGATRRCPL